MPDQVSASGGERLIQVAANAKCYGISTRAWHSISGSANLAFPIPSSAILRISNNAAIPLAIGKRGDMPVANFMSHQQRTQTFRGVAAARSCNRTLRQSAVMDGKT
jgi:hypothetical protein